jgi:hypothetical protein
MANTYKTKQAVIDEQAQQVEDLAQQVKDLERQLMLKEHIHKDSVRRIHFRHGVSSSRYTKITIGPANDSSSDHQLWDEVISNTPTLRV